VRKRWEKRGYEVLGPTFHLHSAVLNWLEFEVQLLLAYWMLQLQRQVSAEQEHFFYWSSAVEMRQEMLVSAVQELFFLLNRCQKQESGVQAHSC